ncbi:hypothetical protein ACFFRR_011098 [Megaselia abdita]
MEFRQTNKDDIPMIRKFLLEEIYPDEPMSRALDLINETYEMQFHLSLVPTGMSWVGFYNGELIGVALCGVKTLGEAERYKQEAERLKGTRWGKVLELGYRIEKESNILQRFGVDKSYHCYLYGIKKSYRGEGLSSQYAHTIQEYVDYVKGLGYRLATGDTTNIRSARLADAFGGILCYEVPYSEFVDDKGRPYITSDSKHKSIRTYAYWIDNWGKSHL